MGTIYIAGLGPGEPGLITTETAALLHAGKRVILRTAVHPTTAWLDEEQIPYEHCDAMYEEGRTFEEIYNAIVEYIWQCSKTEDVVYVVPGSPLVAERTVVLLREKGKESGRQVTILSGMSFLEVLYTAVGLDPVQGVQIIDSKDADTLPLEISSPLIVTQVYSKAVASQVKLALMDRYGDEHEALLVYHLSLPDEKIRRIQLYELDRIDEIDHLTSVVMLGKTPEKAEEFSLSPLADVVAELRSEHGCPWDKLQTHSTLRRYLLEEVYEMLEAIDTQDIDNLREELGDILLQIIFHSRLAEEAGYFTVQDVIQDICDKMVRRHPHVFGKITLENTAEIMVNWDTLKQQEKKGQRKCVLDGVSKGLPSLLQALKLQEKAAKVGFDWQNAKEVQEKVFEEWQEITDAVQEKDAVHMEEEGGDLLFAIVNWLRWLRIEPETALHKANIKFRRRFSHVEARVTASGKTWDSFTLAELDQFWNEAKAAEKRC